MLRRVVEWDKEQNRQIVLLTNHRNFGAITISAIYKDRWQIELFFKALKQNFKVKTFIGTSENALYIQIWTALIAMLLIKYLQFKSKFNWFLSRKSFRHCVQRYGGNYRIRSSTCHEQFLCMAFAQLTYRDSLRDTALCLRALQKKLHHVGIQSKGSRSTLADANENRYWRIYSDFAQILIGQARKLYVDEDFGLELAETVYALDSSTIDLCRSLFP